MAPLPPRRRVSYGIPFPPSAVPVPRLWLPPLGYDRQGSVNPIVIPNSAQHSEPTLHPPSENEPRHRLGVSALALDTTTQLVGRLSPEGILYTGARDGLVIAWDLNIPMRERVYNDHVTRHSSSRWELLTGWVDPVVDDVPSEDQELRSDGDILGDVRGSSRRRRMSGAAATSGCVPFEHQWEPDVDAFRPGQPSTFRQAAQIHSDWVNDILLCNQNQMLVSASSDGTVKAWSPHSTPLSDPVTVGSHADYVRCLAQSRDQGWVASGSFDRTIKLWDLSRASQAATAPPLMTFAPPESSAAKSSIYALAVDPQGHTIVSGGPERVIRMWDPRTNKRIGKLVGHTDNIRAILVSEDSRCLLTASADASIKLWSLTTQRCLHTFTHHTDSVWALYSSHPSLEIFYSGDKSGFVAKIDVEGCAQISEGECALVCQDVAPPAEGVTKLIALDDTLVWTASGSSSLRRWRAPSRRAVSATASIVEPSASAASHTSSRLRLSRSTDLRPRSITLDFPPSPLSHRQSPRHTSSMSAASPPTLEPPLSISGLDEGTGEGETTTWFGLPFDSLVHLASPLSDPFTPFSPVYRGRGAGADADVATLYSAASLMSVSPRPLVLRSPLHGIFPTSPSPPHSPPSIGRPVSPTQSDGLRTGGSGNGGGGGGISSGGNGGSGFGPSPHRAAFESREVVADAQPLSPVPEFVLVGGSGLVRAILLSNRVHALTVDTTGVVAIWDIVRAVCVGQFAQEDVLHAVNVHNNTGEGGSASHPQGGEKAYVCSPREALDIVRERIDGEAFVVPWSFVDTSMGLLNVHLDEHAFDAELYADELGLPPDRTLPASISPDDVRVNLGKWISRNLFLGFIREEEQAHSRRMLAAAAVSSPQTTGNHTTATPPPPPLPHSPQEQPATVAAAADAVTNACAITTGTSTVVIAARNMLPALPPCQPVGLGISQVSLPLAQLSPSLAAASTTTAQPVNGGDESTTQASQPVQGGASSGTTAANTAATSNVVAQKEDVPAPTRRPSVSSGGPGAAAAAAPATPDESGSGTGANTGAGSSSGTVTGNVSGPSGNGVATPGTPGGGIIGKLRGFGRATKRAQNESAPGTPTPTPAPAATRPTGSTATEQASAPASSTVVVTSAASSAATSTYTAPSSTPQTPRELPAKPRTAAQVVLSSGMLTPPTSSDAPSIPLPQDIPLLVAEERAPGWAIVYRGTVTSAGTTEDLTALEDALPVWLLEYLLLGRTPQVAIVKVQFALLPGEESLPELVNPNQTKLSASRFLRVRKLAAHVQERIEALGAGSPGPPSSQHTSPRSSSSLDPPHNQNQNRSPRTILTAPQAAAAAVLHEQQNKLPSDQPLSRPDELWEIVCNETVLPHNMTLAVVRQHVWRQSGEVVLHYRRKRPQTTSTQGKG
ncbi:WD40 repeat-like protein [Russula emetica]|nr:WD40 repeat-like protein [Russula emetica]